MIRSLGPLVSVFFVRAARVLAAAPAATAEHYAEAMLAGCEGISRFVVAVSACFAV
jgi:hypothetical protein